MKYAPIVSEPSRSTIKVEWEAPFEGDAPIKGYKIKRRAGGNTAVGFTKEIDVPGEHIRHFIVCLLSSGTTYEFVVAAYSSVGVGEFSDPSLPISTNFNASNPPLHLHLKKKVEQTTRGRVRGDDDTEDPNKKCPFDTTRQTITIAATTTTLVGGMAIPVPTVLVHWWLWLGLINTTPRFDDGRAMRISPVESATYTGRRHQTKCIACVWYLHMAIKRR